MSSNGTQRIILVDDSEEDRARVRSALLRGAPMRRYLFREATNGADGLKLIQSDDDWPADCVIIDIDMPVMNGMDFLAEITDDEGSLSPVPVIVLTGSSEIDNARSALQGGAQDYITKDAIYPEVLHRTVDNAIERHKMMCKLRESERAADAANRAKSTLIGNISHEIRTPMTAVVGLAELLLGQSLDQEQQHMVEMIRDNGRYLVEIVSDLLDLTKMEAGMLKLSPEPTELRPFLEQTAQLMSVRARDNDTQLTLSTDESLPTASSLDPIRLRQVLLNLLGNAIKFTPSGSVSLEADRAKDTNGMKLRFRVKDTGCGMKAEDLESIFHPFSQAGENKTEQARGTGLGLAICRRLVKAMGGRINVQSELGAGSCFELVIPYRETKALRHTVTPTPSPSENFSLHHRKIVVAEDIRATRYVITKLLEGVGAQVTVVEDGQQLLDLVHDGFDADVIVTDLQMPRVGGLEVARQLRAQLIQTPVIVLTADAISETRDAALSAGANDLVTKPIDSAELLQTLQRWCELRNDEPPV